MELKRVVSGKGLERAREIIVAANPGRAHGSFRFDARYFALIDEGKMKAVVGLKRRGWFLTEVKHLAVPEAYRHKGLGGLALAEALRKVRTPLACATIRTGNAASLALFKAQGFQVVERFEKDKGNVALMVRAIQAAGRMRGKVLEQAPP